MFDGLLPDPATLGDVDDSTLVGAIAGWARVEAAAAARRLAAVAELAARRVDKSAERARWACDDWDAAAAEVAAALHVSHGMASSQMHLAVTLRNRLPRVGGLFTDGLISARLAATIAWHTTLIQDDEALRLVDDALAQAATALGPLSVVRTADAIDSLVDRYDPGALRRNRVTARSREVVVCADDRESGTAALWGRLYSVDAATLDRRLTQMARGVCDGDPRTVAQRRADALGALAAGAETLACGCGNSDCAAGGGDERAAGVVIHVVADTAAVIERPDRHMSGDEPAARPITLDMTLDEALAPEPEPDPRPARSPAVIVGGGTIPASLLGELARGGAKVKPLHHPVNSPPETGYRPSAALDALVRCRDMTCRFPGCDRPATHCDVDHAVPYPFGPTHPSNLRCLCRKHHLLKTFWTGKGGWSDRQLPDGTITWVAPTGQVYTTRPGSRLLFPALCLDTGQPVLQPASDRAEHRRDVMMPIRKRTRTQDRAARIDAERALNNDHVAERNRPPPF